MNVRTNFLDLISLFFVGQPMYPKKQTIIIDVELLKQANIILYLLNQSLLNVPLDTYFLVCLREVKILQSYTALNAILWGLFSASSLLRSFEIITNVDVSRCFKNVRHNDEVYAHFSSNRLVVFNLMKTEEASN